MMEAAYLKASANGTLPANPRQIMYAARDAIQKATGKIARQPVFLADAAGRLRRGERRRLGYRLGRSRPLPRAARRPRDRPGHARGAGLRRRSSRAGDRAAVVAAASVSTRPGRPLRRGAVRREGRLYADPRSRAASRAVRHRADATKGMSVTAARMLVDELCGRRGLKLFVLHDFDITGFSIWKTLTESGRRYKFKHKVNFGGAGDGGMLTTQDAALADRWAALRVHGRKGSTFTIGSVSIRGWTRCKRPFCG